MRPRLHLFVLPLAAAIVVAPLLRDGASCGHDLDFHLLSWLEAARQFAHGNLHPHWASTPAFNAGEPRFVFYPPLSWTLGALLTLLLSHLPHLSRGRAFALTPILFTWIALTSAGLSMHALARRYTAPAAALLGATFYLCNPYTLFTAYERTAFGELLAAAFLPLLLLTILPPPDPAPPTHLPTPGLALAVALLWLTNAPAAVMGSYTIALVIGLRALHLYRLHRTLASPLKLIRKAATGTALGLALAAFYILPAAYERRWVEINLATVPGMRIVDNTLFHHTPDAPHDAVLHTASLLALLLTATSVAALLLASRRAERAERAEGAERERRAEQEGQADLRTNTQPTHLLTNLAILTAVILFLLTPLASPVWRYAPELAFLQFPWRLLAVLAVVLALAIALALRRLRARPSLTVPLALLTAVALTAAAYPNFRLICDPEDTPQARLANFHSAVGAEPTDEYTPITADNDALQPGNPSLRLLPSPSMPQAEQGPAPTHFDLNLPQPGQLILNLRDFPAWRITRNGTPVTVRNDPDNGLLSFPLPPGPSHIDITYRFTPDQQAGDAISLLALAAFGPITLLHRKRRRSEPPASRRTP